MTTCSLTPGADGKTPLHYAVLYGGIHTVLKLIDAGADVNKTDNEGKTPLFYAVKERYNKNVVVKLIDAGADVNITDNEGKTAFFYAVKVWCNENVVLKLIDAGADVKKTDNEGGTPLFYAVKERYNKNVVLRLIDAGADVNKTDNEGKTPLFYALRYSVHMADCLLKKGASLFLEDNYSVLNFLIEEYYELPRDLQARLKIIVDRNPVVKKQILEAIIDVAFCNIFSSIKSSYSVNVDSLSALLRLATNYANKVDFGKRTAIKTILKTIEQPQKLLIDPEAISKILSLLVRKLGANPNSVDSDGNTALHHAIQLSSYGVPEKTVLHICNQLKEMGASLDMKNLKKETPLVRCLVSTIRSRACRQWSEVVQTQLAVCQFLIEHGSVVKEKTESGQSALHLILKLLREVLLDEESTNRCLDDLIRLLQEMLKAQKDKRLPEVIQDDRGNTPLHVWATFELQQGQDYSSTTAEGNTFQNLLKTILDHFSDKNKIQLHVKNENGETLLHLCKTWTAVKLLLDAGANPNDVDSSGRSPLLAAAKISKLVKNRGSLYPDILLAPDKFWRMVLNKGFDPWKVDINNESVLSVLMESEIHDIARALVDVACDERSEIRSRPVILFSLLTAICKDKSPNAQWKKDAAEKILSSTKCPVNGNDKEDSPLHYCCRNIVEVRKCLSIDEIKSMVHWRMVELLRSFGADYRIPDATDQSCLDIAEECPALKDLLLEPVHIDRFSVLIKPWKPVSKTNERCLAEVARHLESNHVEAYWYHKDPLAFGAFGAVYAGINENDGREVAIKRIQKFRMAGPQDQREITSLTALADCEQVVRYLAFFEDKDFSYIVLELMEGNLEDLLNKSITIKEREKLCFDVVKGLSYMHGQGYLHRDLKPTNILFKNSPQLCLKLADFGFSRRMDSTGSSTSVYGSRVGTRCWIAPEVLKSTKYEHSLASDMFSCGLVLHYFLSVKKHPFSPEDCAKKGDLQICAETETNIIHGNKEGWDDSLSPEATHLLEHLLESDVTKRPTAEDSLCHPLFWSKSKKINVLIAVGNQPEFECPRAQRTLPLTAVENDLEASFGTIVKHADWNDPGYLHMPAIYTEMIKKRKRYDTNSDVELIRFIRNAHAHVSESTRPTRIIKLLLEDFVFLEYFPNLVMEVYKAVTTHEWDQTRVEIKYAITK